MPVPSWHQSQQFLQSRCTLFPPHPNFHVSLFFSFCRRAFPQFPPGGNIPWRPSSRSSRGAEVAGAQLRCGQGNRLDTGQGRAPGEGRSRPRLLPLPKPPRRSHFLFLLHPTGFASPWDWGSPGRGRWLRRSPGMVGGSGTPTLSIRALCFLIATGNPFPKPELPYTPRPLPCPEVPYIPRILLINDQPFLAANRSPPLSGGLCRGHRDGHAWPCPRCPLRSRSLAQVGPSQHPPYRAGRSADSPRLSQG